MASSNSSLATKVFVLSFLFSILSFIHAQKYGFGVEMIHRDSPESPFHDPTQTPYERLANSFRESIHRANRIHTAVSKAVLPNEASVQVTAVGGSYVMNFSIGSPPFSTVAIADTGSDIIWTQCEPCDDCFKQDMPLFDPSKSKTYRDVSCDSDQCTSIEKTSCDSSGKSCLYKAAYGDQSTSNGNVAVETLTLDSTGGRPVALPKITFGCGHQNQGTFNTKTSGIVGLGGGSVSLVSQLGSSITGKFSYCLAPYSSESGKSTLNFGAKAVVSGTGAVSTPLFPGSPDTFYYLKLNAISVGRKKITNDNSGFVQSDGNIIIDSGTTLTLLPETFTSDLIQAVTDSIDAETVPDPNNLLSPCYKYDQDLKLPKLTVHFKGADVELQALNTFIRISEDVMCFTFKSTDFDTSIYGNLAQMNFLVGYDREEKTVSFKPTDCEKA
ncbi:hypothetical protein ACFE04_005152 [Oxalis oulophora]